MTATIPFEPTRGPVRRPEVLPGPRPELSEREVEVLIAWLACDSKREVTERLFLADSTVSTYIQRVRSKYDAVGRPARTKVRLLIRAVEDGYIGLDDL
ncbi:LuxR C-terminal-related transcriptional regulator [Dietzia sp. UCD-THP]|uniref:LuxR C-terminal-related transcriptional regulator n=1 Tax=Dietzia sp. UCD-THP TaxID=1292020 RepID=UPI001EE64EDD|nr:LuxR C-terminal-related transcriptional regulator [Dietzia sp. UCD-THP]